MIDLHAKAPIIIGTNRTAPASAINTDRGLTTDAGVSGAEAAPILAQFSGTTPGNGECVPLAFNGRETAVKEIPLNKGYVALVSDEDFERVSRFKWHAFVTKFGTVYGQHSTFVSGKRSSIYLHRFILDAPSHLEVDHRDLNGLNNCRSNLRLCTSGQNNQNFGINPRNKSGYKGVSWASRERKWRATIKNEGRHRSLGYFDDPIKAARAYDAKARELFGEFARTNFGD